MGVVRNRYLFVGYTLFLKHKNAHPTPSHKTTTNPKNSAASSATGGALLSNVAPIISATATAASHSGVQANTALVVLFSFKYKYAVKGHAVDDHKNSCSMKIRFVSVDRIVFSNCFSGVVTSQMNHKRAPIAASI